MLFLSPSGLDGANSKQIREEKMRTREDRMAEGISEALADYMFLEELYNDESEERRMFTNVGDEYEDENDELKDDNFEFEFDYGPEDDVDDQ